MNDFNKEKLFEIMCSLAKNNYVSTQKSDLAKACRSKPSNASFIKAIKELENEGKIILKQKATRNGQKYWSNFIWEIVQTKSDINKINTNEFTTENFKNIQMKLYKTNKGYVVPIVNIANALNVDRQAIHQLIERNKELFNSFLVNVTLTSRKSGNENLCLTKDGIIGLLMKISLKRLPEEKQKLILDFQKWAIEKLTILVSTGKVELSEQEHVKVQNDIGFVSGMTEEQIDKIFNDMDNCVSKLINSAKSTIKKLQEDKDKVEYEKRILKTENQRLINNTLALKEKLYSQIL